MGIMDDGQKPKLAKNGNGDTPKHGNAEAMRVKVAATLLHTLTIAEIEEIQAEVKAQVDAEQKVAAKDEARKVLLKQERDSRKPEQQIQQIYLDLAPHSNRLMVDGVEYFHGFFYNVPLDLFATLNEMMARGWAHEEACGEPNRKFYHKPSYIGTSGFHASPRAHDLVLKPQHVGMPPSAFGVNAGH